DSDLSLDFFFFFDSFGSSTAPCAGASGSADFLLFLFFSLLFSFSFLDSGSERALRTEAASLSRRLLRTTSSAGTPGGTSAGFDSPATGAPSSSDESKSELSSPAASFSAPSSSFFLLSL